MKHYKQSILFFCKNILDYIKKIIYNLQINHLHNISHTATDSSLNTKEKKVSCNSALYTDKKTKDRFQALLLLLIFLICTMTTWFIKAHSMHSNSLQEGIAGDIIRFHVIANSDSSQDQKLKLAVKDALVHNLTPLLKDADTIEAAHLIISNNLADIEELSKEIIRQNGYSYPVTVTLGDCYFPLKIYGDYSFPPGTYEALRVQIGKAKGKNWWCIMFPPLCFVDETYSIVDEESGEKLKHLLTEEEYEALINQEVPVKIKFKLFETLKEIFN